MFSTRSAAVKPRSLFRPWRTLSPSSSAVWTPRAWSFGLDQIGDGRFARARKASEPEDRRLLVLQLRMRLARHRQALAMDIGRAPEPVGDHAGAGGLVGQPVDQDERAGVAIVEIWIVGDRHGGREIAETDLVEVEPLGGELVVGVDVEPMLEVGDGSGDRSASRSSSGTSGRAASARRSSRSRCAVNWSATSGRSSGCASTSPRAMSSSSASVSVTASPASALSVSSSATKICATVVCRPEPATTIGSPLATRPLAIVPATPRKSRWGRLIHCTGRRNGAARAVLLDLDALEIVHQMRALEPWRACAARRHVVAVARRKRDRRTASGSRAARRTCDRR